MPARLSATTRAELPDLSGYPPIMKVVDVASLLGVKTRTVWQWVRDGKIGHFRPGGPTGPLRFSQEDVLRFLLESRVPPSRGRR